MKNLAYTFLPMLFFSVFLFGFAWEASAQSACTGEVTGEPGYCDTSCEEGEVIDVDEVMCDQFQQCCIPDTGGGTCGNGGTCQQNCSVDDDLDPTGICNLGLKCCKKKTLPGGGEPGVVEFKNPLTFETAEDVITAVLNGLRGVIITLALVFLVIGAILYIASGGNEQRIETAKKAIFAAMIGLAIGIAAPSFLREIAEILDWGTGKNDPTLSAAPRIAAILLNTLNFLLGIVGVLAIIVLVFGGIRYLTSRGDETAAEGAKKQILWAIVGIMIAIGSLIIVNQIIDFFN